MMEFVRRHRQLKGAARLAETKITFWGTYHTDQYPGLTSLPSRFYRALRISMNLPTSFIWVA